MRALDELSEDVQLPRAFRERVSAEMSVNGSFCAHRLHYQGPSGCVRAAEEDVDASEYESIQSGVGAPESSNEDDEDGEEEDESDADEDEYGGVGDDEETSEEQSQEQTEDESERQEDNQDEQHGAPPQGQDPEDEDLYRYSGDES